MNARVEPAVNDAAARNTVMDILQQSSVVDAKGEIIPPEDENVLEEGEGNVSDNAPVGASDDSSLENEKNDEVEKEGDDESTEHVDGEAVEIDSSTLAQLLGVNESEIIVTDDGSPLFRAKVDGEEKEISFDSLLRNFRLQRHVDNNATSIKEERKAFDDEMSATRDQYKTALEQAAMVLTAQETSVNEQMNRIDWDSLKEKDPTRYSIIRDEFREQFYNIQNQRNAIVQEYTSEHEKAATLRTSQLEEHTVKQAELLTEALPEWRDKAIAAKQSEELKDYAMKTMQFSEGEIAELIDHRAWIGIRKAMLYDQMIGKADATAKKVVKLPKVVTRKAPIGSDSKKKVRLAAKKTAAQKGDRSAQVDFVNTLIS